MSRKRKMKNRRSVLGVLFVYVLLCALLASCQSCPSPPPPPPPSPPEPPNQEETVSVTRFVAEAIDNPSLLSEDIEGVIDQKAGRITLELPHAAFFGKTYHFTMETEPLDASQVRAEFPGRAEASLEALELPKYHDISPISMIVVGDELGSSPPSRRYDIVVKEAPYQGLTEEIVLEEFVLRKIAATGESSDPESIEGMISGQEIILEVPFAGSNMDSKYRFELKTNDLTPLPYFDLNKPRLIEDLHDLDLPIVGQRDGKRTKIKVYTIKIHDSHLPRYWVTTESSDQELPEEIVMEGFSVKRISESGESSTLQSIEGNIAGQEIILDVPAAAFNGDDKYRIDIRTNYAVVPTPFDLDQPRRIKDLHDLDLPIIGQKNNQSEGYTKWKTYTIKVRIDPNTRSF